MSEHLSGQQVHRFRQRVMSAEELLAADEHLVDCEECRNRLGDSIDWHGPLFSDPAHLLDSQDESSRHLSFELLAGYTDGKLHEADRELVHQHITDCVVCRAELHDLQQLASELPREAHTHGYIYEVIAAFPRWIVAKLTRRRGVVEQGLTLESEPIQQTGAFGGVEHEPRLFRFGPPLLSDEPTIELVAKAREGDREAIEALLQRSLPDLRRWARGRLPAAVRGNLDTEDLVQEAVIHALRRLEYFEPRHVGAMQAYLRQSVINRIRDEVRRVSRQPAVELPGDLAAFDVSPLEESVQRETYDRYRAALSRLKERDRELIVARIEAQWSMEEIAQRFGMNRSAASFAIVRAFKRLSEQLGVTETLSEQVGVTETPIIPNKNSPAPLAHDYDVGKHTNPERSSRRRKTPHVTDVEE